MAMPAWWVSALLMAEAAENEAESAAHERANAEGGGRRMRRR
jgi:hypothetical protein